MLFAGVGSEGRRRGAVAACSVAGFLVATSTNNAVMTWAVRSLRHVPTPAVILGIQATVAALTNTAVIGLMALVLWPASVLLGQGSSHARAAGSLPTVSLGLGFRGALEVVGRAHVWLALWASVVAFYMISGIARQHPVGSLLRGLVPALRPTRIVAECCFVASIIRQVRQDLALTMWRAVLIGVLPEFVVRASDWFMA